VAETVAAIGRDMSRVICLGEAVVDFLAEPPGARLTEAHALVPSFGGSQANVAVGAARLGASSALVGCAGTDVWGEWLRERLASEGVDVALYALREQVATTFAFVSLDREGEPEFSIYGGAAGGMLDGAEERLHELLAEGPSGVLAFGSDTLIVRGDRETVASLKESALGLGWRVLYDPNLRANRWPDRKLMVGVAKDALAGVTVVKANRPEAVLLTGEEEPAAAAAALVARGAGQAVVTLAAEGALLAEGGEISRFPAAAAAVVDTTGAGDAVAAVIATALARSPAVGAGTIEEAMRLAGQVVACRGALPSGGGGG
jgi:fructokinase